MSNPYFQFKQFTVWHDKCAMKVGTDGVLLGAWTSVESAHRILDIGTGTGLVALMLAQRSLPDANIVALEIDEAAVGQARENVIRSPWKERVEVVQADFRKYRSSDKFDVIVSNPPYYFGKSNKTTQLSIARNQETLNIQELFESAKRLLKNHGSLFFVYDASQFEYIVLLCKQNNFSIKKVQFVYDNINACASIVLVYAIKNGKYGMKILEPFILYDKNGKKTVQYEKLFFER